MVKCYLMYDSSMSPCYLFSVMLQLSRLIIQQDAMLGIAYLLSLAKVSSVLIIEEEITTRTEIQKSLLGCKCLNTNVWQENLVL